MRKADSLRFMRSSWRSAFLRPISAVKLLALGRSPWDAWVKDDELPS